MSNSTEQQTRTNPRSFPPGLGRKADGTRSSGGRPAPSGAVAILIVCVVIIGCAFVAFLVLRPTSGNGATGTGTGSGHTSEQGTHLPSAPKK